MKKRKLKCSDGDIVRVNVWMDDTNDKLPKIGDSYDDLDVVDVREYFSGVDAYDWNIAYHSWLVHLKGLDSWDDEEEAFLVFAKEVI